MEDSKKKLSLFELTTFGVGGAIGSGIFVMMGAGIGRTGRSIVLALLLGCIIMMFAFAYNILVSATFPLKGGTYAQTAMLQPPLIAGVAGIVKAIVSMSIAMYAVSVVDYMAQVFPSVGKWTTPLAIGIQTLFFLSTIKGSKFMALLNKIMTIVLSVALIVYILFGLPKVSAGAFAIASEGYFSNGLGGFLGAISIMSLACMGTNGPVELTADAQKPKKFVPLSILITTLVIAVIYGLMAVVSAGVMPVEQVADQSLALVAKQIFPYPVYVLFILGGACFAIATSLYGAIAQLRYPILSTIEDGWFPQVLASKTKGGYPYIVMGFMYLVAVVPILTGMTLDTIVSYMMIPNLVICMFNNLFFLRIPKKYPDAWKKSFLHMPYWLLVIVVAIAVGCDVVVIYNQFIYLSTKDQVMIVAMLAVIFIYCAVRLKSGKVNFKSLADAQAEIASLEGAENATAAE